MSKNIFRQKNLRKRTFKQLTLQDRIKIEIRYCLDNKSLRDIALELGNHRTAGTISREIFGKPRKGYGKYQAHIAHAQALEKRYGKKELRLKNELIQKYVVEKMKLGWSPEQISLRLPIDHKGEHISHEAIYQYIYAQIERKGNGRVKNGCEDLRKYLPRRHHRRAKKGFRKAQKLERNQSLPSIEERPGEVLERKLVGHWEDDSIVSRQSKGRIKSINERVSGLVLLGKMSNGTKEESNKVLINKLKIIPTPYLKTLTRDRGSENVDYQTIEKELNMKVYFAHPYCSSERGSNENLNGLVRRFFPKKTDLAKITNKEIQKVEYLLNTRPRKRFGGKTPIEVLLEKTGVAITY
jgi:IS30 family transposase